MKRHLSLVLCVAAASSLLGGCGYLRTKFGGKPDAYKNSSQTRPLEVPPDLDKPNSSGTLVIPDRSGTRASAAVGDATPNAVATSPSSTVVATGDGIRVTDSVPSTWSRVGLALVRSGVATIESRDEAAYTYQVKANATTSRRPGWFKRAITFGRAGDKKVSTPVTLGVRVTSDGEASKVTIEGSIDAAGENAARDLLETLRQRLS